ncbi:MAG: Na+/H+ antiporter subunit E [Desulfofustis sp.]|nr:Na+/H+ antiporter subunit E [Desulfofustis sp.]
MSVDNLSPRDIAPFRERRPALFSRTKKIISFALTFLICFATWIVLSGRFDLFHLGLGVIACIIVSSLSGTILISRRAFSQLPRQWLQFILYIPWLLYQILLANLQVMYLVFHPRMLELIDPRIIRFKSRLKKPMSLFIFANSITLTPGTITVYVSITGEYAVHVINEQAGNSLPGEMQERVARLMGE